MQRLFLAIFTFLAVLWSACADTPGSPASPVLARLELVAPATTLDPTAVVDITVTAFDRDGAPMAAPALVWASSDPDVVVVRPSGEALAQAAGTARITATSGGITGALDLVVRSTASVVDRIAIGPLDRYVLDVGDSTQLEATAYDVDDNVLAGRSITWRSTDATVGVSATGLITANGPGAATIIAACEGVTATLSVSVTVPAARVDITAGPKLVLRPTLTRQLAAIVYAADGDVLHGRDVSWAIDNTAVATISDDGLVTAVAVGATTATATVEGVTAELAITVRDVHRIQLDPATATIDLVEQVQITAQLFDADNQPIDDYVTWTSDHPEIASVDGAGLVTGVTEGTAIITVTSGTGAATATATIHVAPWAERALVSVNSAPPPATLYEYGGSHTIRMMAEDGVLATRAFDGRYELMVFGPVFVDGVESGFHSHASAGTMTWNATTRRLDFVPDPGFGRPFTGRPVGGAIELSYQPDPQGAPATLVFGS